MPTSNWSRRSRSDRGKSSQRVGKVARQAIERQSIKRRRSKSRSRSRRICGGWRKLKGKLNMSRL